MSNTVGAIIIAVVGVLGALGGSIVNQVLSARTRRDDFQVQQARQEKDYSRQKQEGEFASKKSSYIAIIASSRTYRVELMNYLHVVKRDTADSVARSDLQQARRTWLANFSEVQIVAPLRVLSAIEPVNTGMAAAYRTIRNLEDGEPEPDGFFEDINQRLVRLWDEWGHMREAMRRDLGVPD